MARIDNNRKGLSKREDKFYSLILSPAPDELAHIGSEPGKLTQYTKQVMENYAQNFKLKSGKGLQADELVWFATIHQERAYNGKDQRASVRVEELKEQGLSRGEAIQTMSETRDKYGKNIWSENQARDRVGQFWEVGAVKEGAFKPGLNAHIHVIVSARDEQMQHTLNPQGRKEKFNLKAWQQENGKSFQQLFGYEKETTSEKLMAHKSVSAQEENRHRERIDNKVAQINSLFGESSEKRLNKEKVQEIAQNKLYDKSFFMNLNQVHKRLKEGKPVADAYTLLETNKDRDSFTGQQGRGAAFSQSFQTNKEKGQVLPESRVQPIGREMNHIDTVAKNPYELLSTGKDAVASPPLTRRSGQRTSNKQQGVGGAISSILHMLSSTELDGMSEDIGGKAGKRRQRGKGKDQTYDYEIEM